MQKLTHKETTCWFFRTLYIGSNKETPEEVEGINHDNGTASGGTFLQTKNQPSCALKIRSQNPSTEVCCIPQDIKEGDCPMMDPACEVNEKVSTEKKDGIEALEEGTYPPLDVDPNEIVEAAEETFPLRTRTGKTASR